MSQSTTSNTNTTTNNSTQWPILSPTVKPVSDDGSSSSDGFSDSESMPNDKTQVSSGAGELVDSAEGWTCCKCGHITSQEHTTCRKCDHGCCRNCQD